MGQGLGVWINTHTGEVMVTQGVYVAAESLLFIVAVVLGLITAKLVLP